MYVVIKYEIAPCRASLDNAWEIWKKLAGSVEKEGKRDSGDKGGGGGEVDVRAIGRMGCIKLDE